MKNVKDAVNKIFNEHGFKDLMECGTGEDGLYDISEIISECLEEVGIHVDNHYSDDGLGDGKYIVCFIIGEKEFSFDISAWNGVDEIVDIIETIREEVK